MNNFESKASSSLSSTELRTLPRVGQALVEAGAISVHQLREALRQQSMGGQRLLLGEVLLQMELVDRTTLLQAVARTLEIEFVPDPAKQADAAVMKLLPESMRREHRVVPLRRENDLLLVATADPQNDHVRELAQRTCGLRVRFVASPELALDAMLAEAVNDGAVQEKAEEIVAEMLDTGAESGFTLQEKQVEEMVGGQGEDDMGPVVKLVNFIICSAVDEGASDIHIEPDDNTMRVRFRIDGVLGNRMSPPWRMNAAIASRVKIMAHLDISERRVPQDGRIKTTISGRQIDLRVSTLPTQFGESVVLRILDKTVVNLSLEALSMQDDIKEGIRAMVGRPNGIFIVTGPTGSGKTTTLYSALREVNTEDVKILTAEDPVEYEVEGIMQVPINHQVGLTFAAALRSFLRQDPDTIMVGEIRDLETAQIAVQASLTGHVVLSTLHTNDAPGAVTRLIDMGLEPFLISASLEGVLAQRLLRRVCKTC